MDVNIYEMSKGMISSIAVKHGSRTSILNLRSPVPTNDMPKVETAVKEFFNTFKSISSNDQKQNTETTTTKRKYTDSEIREVLRMADSGMTYGEISRKLGYPEGSIYNIVNRRRERYEQRLESDDRSGSKRRSGPEWREIRLPQRVLDKMPPSVFLSARQLRQHHVDKVLNAVTTSWSKKSDVKARSGVNNEYLNLALGYLEDKGMIEMERSGSNGNYSIRRIN